MISYFNMISNFILYDMSSDLDIIDIMMSWMEGAWLEYYQWYDMPYDITRNTHSSCDII